jgi:hypothetical protein
MDEDSIGWFGMAIVTVALVISHPLHASPAHSVFDDLTWQDVVDAYSCKDVAFDDCYLTNMR